MPKRRQLGLVQIADGLLYIFDRLVKFVLQLFLVLSQIGNIEPFQMLEHIYFFLLEVVFVLDVEEA